MSRAQRGERDSSDDQRQPEEDDPVGAHGRVGAPRPAPHRRSWSRSARRAALIPRRRRDASAPGGRPGPRRGIAATAHRASVAAVAGKAVSQRDRSGPNTPSASTAPSTATARKFTPLLHQKEGDRPTRNTPAVHASAVKQPGAQRQPASAAGRDQRAPRQLRAPDLPASPPAQPGAEDRPEHDHSGGEREALEQRRQHQPAGASAGQPVSHLTQPRCDQDDCIQNADRGGRLQRAPTQCARLKLVRPALPGRARKS